MSGTAGHMPRLGDDSGLCVPVCGRSPSLQGPIKHHDGLGGPACRSQASVKHRPARMQNGRDDSPGQAGLSPRFRVALVAFYAMEILSQPLSARPHLRPGRPCLRAATVTQEAISKTWTSKFECRGPHFPPLPTQPTNKSMP